MQEDAFYQTTDLSLAAALLTIGHELDSMEKVFVKNKNQIMFHFFNDDSFQNDLNSYWAKKLLIEPHQFYANIKFLKTKIYEGL